jgi:hypothetical protein
MRVQAQAQLDVDCVGAYGTYARRLRVEACRALRDRRERVFVVLCVGCSHGSRTLFAFLSLCNLLSDRVPQIM